MSVMKAIKQMKDESDIMRAQGRWTDEEIDQFVSDFCDAHGFPKASVENVIAMAEEQSDSTLVIGCMNDEAGTSDVVAS